MAANGVAVGLTTGGGSVVKDPVALTVLPDSFTPIIRNEYIVEALSPVSLTDAVVGAPPSTKPGTTVAVDFVANVASLLYSKLNDVGAYPGLTSINTSALWWVMFVTLFCATTGATMAAPPSVGDTKSNLLGVPAGKPVSASLVDSASMYCATWATEAVGLRPKYTATAPVT